MKNDELAIKIREIIEKLANSEIASHIDKSPPPPPFRGKGIIKLIILGQDPTVHHPENRKNLKVTLNLDQPGGLRKYAQDICKGLGLDLDQNIYATNLLKNFFIIPPDKMRKKDPHFFRKAADYWIPLLKEEIAEFENVSVLTLGEPVQNSLINSPDRILIRYYWGFEAPGKYGRNFGYMKPSENVLGRVIFPFPHLPGLKHPIYRQQMPGYLSFLKKQFFPVTAKP